MGASSSPHVVVLTNLDALTNRESRRPSKKEKLTHCVRRAPVLRSRREEVPCEVFARQRRCRYRRSNRASSRSRTLVRNDHRDLQSIHGACVHLRRKRAAARPGGTRPSSRGQVASQGRCRIRPDGDNENPNCLVTEREEYRRRVRSPVARVSPVPPLCGAPTDDHTYRASARRQRAPRPTSKLTDAD